MTQNGSLDIQDVQEKFDELHIMLVLLRKIHIIGISLQNIVNQTRQKRLNGFLLAI